mmetsp:Transcript_51259/g.134993  ORF Transcript_51259/g.134993 Transcript_51259/m.134993 type:complete len:261 (+) Transcript_51259:73-855(+)
MSNTTGAEIDHRDEVARRRHNYPRGSKDVKLQRRIMGFGVGFEKIFATTSIKLPASACTVYVEMKVLHSDEVFTRCFNGLHTVHDMKKWIFEITQVPIDAYDLSYAEPGKAALDDKLRLLTTQDSLDSRTMSTMRAVHDELGLNLSAATGVHSVDDIGVTRLYVRLKCRTCGEVLTSLQSCRRHIPRGEAVHTVEDCWYRPDPAKQCLFDTGGYDIFTAARAHGKSSSEIARLYISCGEEPKEKLRLEKNVLTKDVRAGQ